MICSPTGTDEAGKSLWKTRIISPSPVQALPRSPGCILKWLKGYSNWTCGAVKKVLIVAKKGSTYWDAHVRLWKKTPTLFHLPYHRYLEAANLPAKNNLWLTVPDNTANNMHSGQCLLWVLKFRFFIFKYSTFFSNQTLLNYEKQNSTAFLFRNYFGTRN